MADPKQPQFFASYLAARARTDGTHANIVGQWGSGKNFGFYTRREGCKRMASRSSRRVFSQFDLSAPSSDLINTDYVVGVPLSWRSGGWSTRVRLYHQSSHLGDEFPAGPAGVQLVESEF